MSRVEREITIKAPWGNISALTWGEPTNPPVFLCHGKLDVASGFRPLVLSLPDSFFYVSVDLPGNGKSDQLPRGLPISMTDLVPTVLEVKEHFKWNKFIYIGHSLGVYIGKYFNIAYPGVISRMVELDPIPAHEIHDPHELGNWYRVYFDEYYNKEKFIKYNAGVETAPKYSYEKALELMLNGRGLTKEASTHVLERALEPVGDGLYRFTYDQRMKLVSCIPFSSDYMRQIYTSSATPIFCILAKFIIDAGVYDKVPFVRDEAAWPNKNYKYKIVEGTHDVHINNPGCMADDIAKFLLQNYKAKM